VSRGLRQGNGHLGSMPRYGRAGYRYQYVETAASSVFSIDTARDRDRERSTKLCRAACNLVMKFGAFRSRFATDQQQTVAFLCFGLDDVFGRLLDASRNLGPILLHIRGCRYHIASFGTLLERRFGAFGLARPLF